MWTANHNTQEVKKERFLISTRKNNVHIFSFPNSVVEREEARFQLRSSTVTSVQLRVYALSCSIIICLSVCRFGKGNATMPKIRTLFCLVDIKKRSFLTT